MSNPNSYARLMQLKAWKQFPIPAKVWIMMVNYFFAVLPGILFVLRNVYIEQTKQNVRPASFGDSVYITTLVVQVLLLFMSISQQIIYNRFMALRMVRVFMIGQIVSIILMLISTNEKFIGLLRSKFKKKNKNMSWILLFLVILIMSFVGFILYVQSPISELT